MSNLSLFPNPSHILQYEITMMSTHPRIYKQPLCACRMEGGDGLLVAWA